MSKKVAYSKVLALRLQSHQPTAASRNGSLAEAPGDIKHLEHRLSAILAKKSGSA